MQFWIMIYSNNKMYSLVTHAVYKGRDIAENIHYPRYTQAPGVIYISHYKIIFFYFEKKYMQTVRCLCNYIWSVIETEKYLTTDIALGETIFR